MNADFILNLAAVGVLVHVVMCICLSSFHNALFMCGFIFAVCLYS